MIENIKVGDSEYIRDLNLVAIFKLISKMGPISRKKLAEKTDYSPGTISNHVKTLMNKGFVIETEKGDSTGGRKPIYISVNPEKGYIISINIAVNYVKIVIFNLKLNRVKRIKFSINNGDQSEQVLKHIQKKLDNILKEKQIPLEKIMGIGVALPGLINKEKNKLEFAPNLGWQKIAINDYFKKYEVPIILENDANAAVVGEREFVYPDSDNMVFVSINEGIGCGLIFDGQLYRGASGNSGEYGHIIIDQQGRKCHCGNNGCWETIASTSYLIDRYEQLSGKNEVNLEDIVKDIKTEAKEIQPILKEVAGNIGLGLVNIINSLSPKLVVIGGGITKFKKYIEPVIHKTIKKKTINSSWKQVELKFTKLNDMAVLYGLASNVFNKSMSLIKK